VWDKNGDLRNPCREHRNHFRVFTKMIKGNLSRKRRHKFAAFLSLLSASLLGVSSVQANPVDPTVRCTTASHYGVGDGFHGRTTANGEVFNAYELTAAHRHLPFGTVLLVTNSSVDRKVRVRINDRGPFVAGKNLDLSYGAFKKIADPRQGVVRVCYFEVAHP
jgi:rare lipoprotein A